MTNPRMGTKAICKDCGEEIDFVSPAWRHTKHQFRHIAIPEKEPEEQPRIVCLCGSTRFGTAYQLANLEETLAGRIVLTIGCDMKSDSDLFANKSPGELEEIKTQLDWLHFRKIDLADEVLILNVGGYIGESTRRERDYAQEQGKKIRWLEIPL